MGKGDKKPVWGDTFKLEVDGPTDELQLRCWDLDMTTSDAIGFNTIKMASLMINNKTEDSYDIFYDNKVSASIVIRSIFEPKGGD